MGGDMKLALSIILIIYILVGCANKTQPIERSYSCFNTDQKNEISYKSEQVFYTRLKSGYGVVAFKTADRIVRQLHAINIYENTCSVVKVS